jgi:hypothetical protein
MTRKKSRRPAAPGADAAARFAAPEGAESADSEVTDLIAATVDRELDLGTLTETAGFVPEDAVVRRTKDGWRVGGDELPDLTCAMVLADLLAAEGGLTTESPAKPDTQAATGETGRLRATVGQLEHALITRIRVEQAIGVLAERHRIKPRQAFEQLRDAARSRGRKVIDIAGDVVASATNPLLQLPDELSRPRTGPRRSTRQPSGAQ